MPMLRCSSANMGEENEKRCILRRGISHFLSKSHHPSATLLLRQQQVCAWRWECGGFWGGINAGIEVYIGACKGRKEGKPLGRMLSKEGLNLGEPPHAYISPTRSPLTVAPLFSHFWKQWDMWEDGDEEAKERLCGFEALWGQRARKGQRDYLHACGAAGLHGHSGWQL